MNCSEVPLSSAFRCPIVLEKGCRRNAVEVAVLLPVVKAARSAQVRGLPDLLKLWLRLRAGAGAGAGARRASQAR